MKRSAGVHKSERPSTRQSTNRCVDRLATLHAVALFWICYGIIFSAIQFFSSSTLALDTAAVVENVQRTFALGYQIRNPPLFDWMYFVAQEVLGDGNGAHSFLRYSLIFAIGVLHYAAFRQVGCSRRLAAAFSYSLIFFIWMASDFHYHFTHSLPLFAVGLAAWVCALAYIDRNETWLAMLLGLLIGLGLIAKWSFPLPLAGAAIAIALDRRARGAFANWRSLLILAVAAVPIAPVAYWIATVDANPLPVAHELLIGTAVPYVDRVGPAILKYLESIIAYLLPWPIFVGLIFFATRKRRGDVPAPLHPNGRLAISMTFWTIGLAFAGVVVVGVGNMGMRYMFPVLLVAPIAMAAWIVPRVQDKAFSRATINVALIFALIAVLIRFFSFQVLDSFMPQNRLQIVPYEELALELAKRGFSEAQFVTTGGRDAGNLMVQLPEARASSVNSLRVEPPPRDALAERPCVAIWGETRGILPELPKPQPPPSYLRSLIEEGSGEINDVLVRWPKLLYGNQRQSLWRYVVLSPETPLCRYARGL